MSLDLTFTVDDAKVWSGNITHNLTRMAEAIGAYDALWRPEENGIEEARQLIVPLTAAREKLLQMPEEKLCALEPENKWGTAKGFDAFLWGTIRAARKWPGAKVTACR